MVRSVAFTVDYIQLQLMKYLQMLHNDKPRRKCRKWKAHRIAQGKHWWAQLCVIPGLCPEYLQSFFWCGFGVRPLYHRKVRVSTSRRNREFCVTGYTLNQLITTWHGSQQQIPLSAVPRSVSEECPCGLLKGNLWLIKICCPRPYV